MTAAAPEQNLAGKFAVITGGSRGIGLAIARCLGKAGAHVILLARNTAQLEHARAELASQAIDASAVACDLADPNDISRIGQQLGDEYPIVDVLVHNAGEAQSASIERVDVVDWDLTFAVHCRAVMLLTQRLLHQLRASQRAKLLAINSVAGLHGAKYLSAYCAAKHAQVGLMKVFAAELAATNIDVHTLCPGFVDTQIARDAIARQASKAGISSDRALAQILATSGQTRLLEPVEIANRVRDLCLSRDADLRGCIEELVP